MKRLLTLIVFVSAAFAAQAQKAASISPGKKTPQEAYNIKIKIKGLHDTMVYLANYFGDNTYYSDSALMDKNGVATFTGDTALGCGIYIVAVNRTKLFEVVIKEQFFSIETDTLDFTANMKVKNSPENDMFYEYQKYSALMGQKAWIIEQELKKPDGDPTRVASKKVLEDSMKQINMAVLNFRVDFIKKYPQSVLAKLFLAMKDPDVPEKPAGADSSWQFHYYKAHFWDNVDFTTDCIIRSPVYHNKLKRYIQDLTYQIPDSINAAADIIVEKTRGNGELFKYTVQWITSTYERSEYMCMDGVFVHMALKYYTYDQCFWLDSTAIYRIRSRAETLAPTMCNVQAPELEMHDTTLERMIDKIVKTDSNEERRAKTLGELLYKESKHIVNLYGVKAEYTVVVFWDPDCGHCQKEIPKIKAFYDIVKSKGVQVYAVGVEQDLENWLKYIRDKKLDWINVIDMYNISQFRKNYDISSTPVILLLDKNKRIIAKKIGAEQLEQILRQELKMPPAEGAKTPAGEGEQPKH